MHGPGAETIYWCLQTETERDVHTRTQRERERQKWTGTGLGFGNLKVHPPVTHYLSQATLLNPFNFFK